MGPANLALLARGTVGAGRIDTLAVAAHPWKLAARWAVAHHAKARIYAPAEEEETMISMSDELLLGVTRRGGEGTRGRQVQDR